MNRRLIIVSILFGLFFLGITARLVAIQVVENNRWTTYAKRIQEHEIIEVSPRGRILDRNGVLLAQDLPAMSIALDNYHMSQPEVLLDLLNRYLGLDRQELSEKIYKEGYFTWIARQVDLQIVKALRAEAQELGVLGLIFINEPKRVYPQQSLASNVIGFTNVDHEGLEGVEKSYDDWLSGDETTIKVVRTASGIELVRQTKEEGKPGADLILTLDARIQRIAEEKLDAGLRQFKAKTGFVVILNPQTGEVLAMAQDRRYDLNNYRNSTAESRLNQAVARAYEPGSLFKVFSGLAALQNGVVGLNETFDGDTKVRVGSHAFGNAEDNVKFGSITLKTIIQNSVNIGIIQIAQRIGERPFYQYLSNVGFGRPTQIGLPGELPGTLIPVERWSPLEIASVSIGQAVTVTGIQLSSRLAAMGNEGRIMQPYIVGEVRDSKGNALLTQYPKSVGRIASLLNTQLMREMMEAVVEAGSGMRAQLNGFSVAAKSGTAQKVIPGVPGYSPNKFISSFGGFFPAEDPHYFILVVLDEVGIWPVWGGQTAASIFHEISERLIVLEKIYPQK